MQVCGFQTWMFMARFLHFIFYIIRTSDQRCFGVYSQSNLLDRMLQLHSYQAYPQDYFPHSRCTLKEFFLLQLNDLLLTR